MSEDTITMYVVLGIFSIVIVGIILYFINEKARTKALKGLAGWMGLAFENKPKDDTAFRLSSLNFFPGAHSHKVFNMLSGMHKENQWKIFDYRYTIGHGKHSQTYSQTYAMMLSNDFRVPRFSLNTQHFFHKIGKVFGLKDIDFKDYPVFSKKYLLKSQDEDMIRMLFVPEVLDFFQRQQKMIHMIAQDTMLVFYYHRKRLAPREVRPFLDTAAELLDTFKKYGQSL